MLKLHFLTKINKTTSHNGSIFCEPNRLSHQFTIPPFDSCLVSIPYTTISLWNCTIYASSIKIHQYLKCISIKFSFDVCLISWTKLHIPSFFSFYINHIEIHNGWRLNTKRYDKPNDFTLVSEWLLLNANSAIFQLYHDEDKLIFNEIMMRSALF